MIEQAVVTASSMASPYANLMTLLAGVVLLGTPHAGSKMQKWGSMLARLASMVEMGEPILMQDVDEKSMKIFDLVYDFMQVVVRTGLGKDDAVVCFYENMPTNYLQRYGISGNWVGKTVSSMVGSPLSRGDTLR